jgi:hypothetical protein
VFETLLNSGEVISLIKIITLIFLAIYIIFTFVILTQVRVMNRILNETFASNLLMIISVINILLPLSLFLIALAIL